MRDVSGEGDRGALEGRVARPAESIQVRADPAWIARLKATAKRMGLSVSGYVRSTMTREMDRTARRRPDRS